MAGSTSNPTLKMKEMNSAIISLLLELNAPTTRGKFGNLIVEPLGEDYSKGFKLWERGLGENYTVVMDSGSTISLAFPNAKVKLNSSCIEKTFNTEGRYPKVNFGWAGESNENINKGDLVLILLKLSPVSSITCLASRKYKGRFDRGITGNRSELSACGFPEELEKEKEILGQEVKKVIDFGTEAEKIIKDSKLTDLFNALGAMERAKK